MKMIKSSTNYFYFLYTLGILIVLSFFASCNNENSDEAERMLELGKIAFNPNPDTCENSMCYEFTSSSSQVKDIKTGIIRIDEPEGIIVGTVAMYSGGMGISYYSDQKVGKTLIEEALNRGYRVIQIKWNEGWFVGSPGKLEGFRKLAVHPATITQFIYENLVDKSKPFILFGGSGGAAQIAYMLSFYGIDAITDKAIILSGFWMGRLEIGCFDNNQMNSHLHYSERARAIIDKSLGFSIDVKGPCELRDTSYYDIYQKSSISRGGNYYYPNTEVFLIYSGNDQVGALNQGLTYYEQLAYMKSPLLHMQIVPGAKHSLLWDSTGFEVVRKILFEDIDFKTTTNKQ